MQEGAIKIDQLGTIFYCNRRFAEWLEVPHERLIGKSLQSFLVRDDATPLASMLDQARLSPQRGELTLVPADNEPIPVILTLSFDVRNDDLVQFSGVITDQTAHVRHVEEIRNANSRLLEQIAANAEIEQKLLQSQKLEAIGQLAAGVAHDFNNILQSVVSSLELVLDDVPADTAAHEFAKLALEATSRGASLTDHLLSYARKQSLRPRVVELAPFLASMQQFLRPTLPPNIAIELCVEGAPSVIADAGQIQTAVLNLALNAADAMPRGGVLSIGARPSPDSNAWVVITVTDTGTGMSAATLSQAVDPFFTTKGPIGTGLGLSMVHGFAEQSGGKLRVESVLGEGTTVELLLPASDLQPSSTTADTLVGGRRGRILLVDDSKDVLATTGAFLEKAGFSVVCVDSGEMALAALDGNEIVDIMVTDYAMPGLNGGDLIIAGRIRRPGLAAILITGYSEAGTSCNIPEGTLVIRKPFQRSELTEALQHIMAAAPRRFANTGASHRPGNPHSDQEGGEGLARICGDIT
jgi:signal transduction histidine kinase/ActR/RegA family two-component response regulator